MVNNFGGRFEKYIGIKPMLIEIFILFIKGKYGLNY
jgi:hypothetical protein